MRIITIALLTTLATLAPANAQDVRFHDRAGRVTGSARTEANGVTTFHDRAGRVTGTARTDRNGVAVAADKALALIARDIAKRRKALAGKLAEHRHEQRALRRFMRTGELPR